jgi:hypothetical protein
VDHQTAAIVWCAQGGNAATLQQFVDLLSEGKHSIRAVSIEVSERRLPEGWEVRTLAS